MFQNEVTNKHFNLQKNQCIFVTSVDSCRDSVCFINFRVFVLCRKVKPLRLALWYYGFLLQCLFFLPNRSLG